MHEESRPTCVTVIGWAWILIGGLTFLSSVVAISVLTVIDQTADSGANVFGNYANSGWFFVLTTAVYVVGSLLAFIAGIYFLRLRMWARHLLEIITWIAIALVVLSMAGSVQDAFLVASEPGMDDFLGASLVSVIGINLLYVVGLTVMLRYLRGERVRNALTDAQ